MERNEDINTSSLSSSLNSTSSWYVIHVYSGSEASVVNEIKHKVDEKDLSSLIEDLVIPIKEVPHFKKGKKVFIKKNFLPGYVLLKAVLTDDLLSLIRSIPRVSGFLGTKRIDGVPKAVSIEEIKSILHNIDESADNSAEDGVHYEIGERAIIAEGPFATFSGTVEEVDNERKKIKLSVSIFDRLVTVELNFDQISKEIAE